MDGCGWLETARSSKVSYDRREGLLSKETPDIRWRIDSLTISSPAPLSSVFHWRCFIPPWPFFKFSLALHPHPPISPPHISRLAPSFPLRHHHCYYNRVSLSLTHAFLFTLWHLSISFCPPSRSTCGMAVSLPYWGATVRYWTSHIPATSYWVDPTLWSQPALTRLCSAAPLELPTLRWVHVWVCENLF